MRDRNDVRAQITQRPAEAYHSGVEGACRRHDTKCTNPRQDLYAESPLLHLEHRRRHTATGSVRCLVPHARPTDCATHFRSSSQEACEVLLGKEVGGRGVSCKSRGSLWSVRRRETAVRSSPEERSWAPTRSKMLRMTRVVSFSWEGTSSQEVAVVLCASTTTATRTFSARFTSSVGLCEDDDSAKSVGRLRSNSRGGAQCSAVAGHGRRPGALNAREPCIVQSHGSTKTRIHIVRAKSSPGGCGPTVQR